MVESDSWNVRNWVSASNGVPRNFSFLLRVGLCNTNSTGKKKDSLLCKPLIFLSFPFFFFFYKGKNFIATKRKTKEYNKVSKKHKSNRKIRKNLSSHSNRKIRKNLSGHSNRYSLSSKRICNAISLA